MIPHFRRSVKMEGQWYRISWEKGQKKTSVNSARHINSIDFFGVILYDMINAQVLYAGLDPGPGKSAL